MNLFPITFWDDKENLKKQVPIWLSLLPAEPGRGKSFLGGAKAQGTLLCGWAIADCCCCWERPCTAGSTLVSSLWLDGADEAMDCVAWETAKLRLPFPGSCEIGDCSTAGWEAAWLGWRAWLVVETTDLGTGCTCPPASVYKFHTHIYI